MLEIKNAVVDQLHWHAAVRGIIAILFGIIALVLPGISLLVLIYLFGAFAMMSGILALIAAFDLRPIISLWWTVLLEGLAGIIIGLITLFWPGITGLVLLLFIAFWAVALGICELAAAFSSSASPSERWMTGIAGALSIVFGILLFTHPGAGLLTVIWLIGFYAIIWGIVLLAYAVQRQKTITHL
jgi:uncharacterized membrane protein HdeD (DUF308 family)